MKLGRIDPCQQKGKCRGPRKVTFGAVEAYLSRKDDLDAASSNIRQCMSTADAIVQRHSVTYEFDFLDQHSAARRACTMSWDVASSVLGIGGYDGFPSFQQCIDCHDPDIGDNEPFDTPEEDLAEHHPLVHLEWRAHCTLPTFLCSPSTPVGRDDAILVALSPWCSPGTTLTLRTYGYFGRDVGQRDVRAPCDELHRWKDFVDDAWSAYAQPAGCKVTILQPQRNQKTQGSICSLLSLPWTTLTVS